MSSRDISNVWDVPGLFSHRRGQHFSLCGFSLIYFVYNSKIKSTISISGQKLKMQQHCFLSVAGTGNAKRRGVNEGRTGITTFPSENKFKFFARETFYQ